MSLINQYTAYQMIAAGKDKSGNPTLKKGKKLHMSILTPEQANELNSQRFNTFIEYVKIEVKLPKQAKAGKVEDK